MGVGPDTARNQKAPLYNASVLGKFVLNDASILAKLQVEIRNYTIPFLNETNTIMSEFLH
jgi:hypothetical protein